MNQGQSKKTAAAVKRSSFFWNAAYTGISALQPAILLIAVSRTRELGDAGILTFGFAVANLVMIIARYGIRNFQVTDVNEQFRFSDYFYCRICTTAGALIASMLYLLIMLISGQYTFYKGLLIFEIVLYKLIDAFEGVYVGRLQQKGRLDMGARFGAIRLIISTIVIFGLTFLTGNLWISLLAGIIVSVLIDSILIPRTSLTGNYHLGKKDTAALKKLLFTGISLCLGTALHNIAGNAPKYLVEISLNDEVQAISGYVMLPVFVITILNLFIMQPLVKEIGDVWNQKNRNRLRQLILRQSGIIFLLSVAVAILGIYVGLPLLSFLYNISLTAYAGTFVLYLIGGIFYTLSEYFMVFLVAARKQHILVVGSLAAILVNTILGVCMLPAAGMQGTAIIYIAANLSMLMIFLITLVRTIRTEL